MNRRNFLGLLFAVPFVKKLPLPMSDAEARKIILDAGFKAVSQANDCEVIISKVYGMTDLQPNATFGCTGGRAFQYGVGQCYQVTLDPGITYGGSNCTGEAV